MDIIAADLGKFNSMFCFYDSATREHSTAKASTDRSYFHSVLKSKQPDLVVVEAWATEKGDTQKRGTLYLYMKSRMFPF